MNGAKCSGRLLFFFDSRVSGIKRIRTNASMASCRRRQSWFVRRPSVCVSRLIIQLDSLCIAGYKAQELNTCVYNCTRQALVEVTKLTSLEN